MNPAARLGLPFLALAALAAGPPVPPAAAQDKPSEPAGLDDEPPKPLTPEEEKEAKKLFAEAKAMVERGQGLSARAKFELFLKKYPGADPDMVREADDRSGPNCLVGIELQHSGGPPDRRIDVELMGDGYLWGKVQAGNFKRDALNQMKEFWKEPLYDEYASYFNVWRFDLVSAEDGVDQLTNEEKMGLPPPPPEDKPGKKKRGPKKYSTALNCIAAGGGNQVWADPEQVARWRQYFEHGDGLTIAFAKKGELGMGGGGIATTGRRVAVVHEFGHAFVLLLDEYAVDPSPPRGRVFAPNAISSDPSDPRKPPPLDEVPWRHWLSVKASKIDLFLGGATHQQGVFRPAASCAMNAGGSDAYCAVCREAGVLRIYSYLSPIDESGPLQERVDMILGESREFFVQPLVPKSHRLQAEWTLQVIAPSPDQAPPVEAPAEGESYVEDDRAGGMWQREGDRAAERRADPLPEGNPKGVAQKATVKKLAGNAFRSIVTLAAGQSNGLPPGVYRLTARVYDDTKVPGTSFPWVIKDPDRLREEWKSWTIVVAVPKAAAPPPPAAPPTPPAPGGK